MVSFTQILAAATACAGLSSALVAKPSTEVRAPKGTACCTGVDSSCNTVTGTAPTGQTWAYCWHNGDIKWTGAERDMSECLTDLHVSQNSACISGGDGTPCPGNAGVTIAQDSFLWGNHQLDEDSKTAIFAAIDEATKAGIMFGVDGHFPVSFVHTADNGSGIHGIDMYGPNDGC
ncbi:hypothetical protein V490_08580 [Pseudogymnoascus sp. VKM F-3557]|nr:hypothetical protein V490_08580 [Pseudogymnoascus sp. VKM F-3557]